MNSRFRVLVLDVDSGAVRHGVYVDRPTRMLAREILVDEGVAPFVFGSRAIHYGQDVSLLAKWLAAERGATLDQTVAVGDWLNDVPMLKAAGRSYVMGGSLPEVEAVADEVLDAEREHGGAIAEVAARVWGITV